jgi:hypothetical protein
VPKVGNRNIFILHHTNLLNTRTGETLINEHDISYLERIGPNGPEEPKKTLIKIPRPGGFSWQVNPCIG